MIDQGDVYRSAFLPRKAEAVTPADSDISSGRIYLGLYVGTGGNVSVRMADDSADVTYTNVQSGAMLPIAVKRVNSTNTTATNIVGFPVKP
jgi:hypothetical protein